VAPSLTFAFPGDINTLTGGYLYDKRVMAELGALGWAVHPLSLDRRLPWVDDVLRQQTAELLAQVDAQDMLIIDGLALGALGRSAQLIRRQRPFTALVHHPLALESGIDGATAQRLHEAEMLALEQASQVIVTSAMTCSTLVEQFCVPAQKITVIMPGVEPVPAALTAGATLGCQQPRDVIRLLSVGSLVHRKGFDLLINALGSLRHLPWRLNIVGDDQRSPDVTKEIERLIAAHELSDRIAILGAQPTEVLNKEYQQADVFVLASRYEGYGMAYAEALAWGLPVIGTEAGAARDTLDTPGAMMVGVEDTPALSAALDRLISQPALRQKMRTAALEHAKQLLSWQRVGQLFAQTLMSPAGTR
jgi:glycosyltransferase involved in cell wall biosynthesis